MPAKPPPCRYCTIVNTICFWGERPQAGWKRPLLLVLSLLINIGLAASMIMAWAQAATHAFFLLLALGLWLVSLLGILVAWHGCDACVARLMGDP